MRRNQYEICKHCTEYRIHYPKHFYDWIHSLQTQRTYRKRIIPLEEIKFSVDFSTEDDPDIDEMSVEQLRAYLAELEGRLDEIESNEPDDNGSDAYDEWSDKRDELEDLISEVEDRLDELGD